MSNDLPTGLPTGEDPPRSGQHRLLLAAGLVIVGLIAALVVPIGNGHDKTDATAVAGAVTVTQTVTVTTTTAAAATPPKADVGSQTSPSAHQTRVHLPGVGRDGGVTFRVTSIRPVSRIAVGEFSDPIVRKPHTKLIRVNVTYKNNTAKPVDPFCGGRSIVLLDTRGRSFPPDDDYLDIAGNTICSPTRVPPGSTSKAALAFSVPRDAITGGVEIWNADDEDFDGSASNLFFEK